MAPNPTSSALVPVKVDNDNLVEEKIDERILAILGIGDVFDLTYEEYVSLLKEKSIEYRMSSADAPTESVELITEEFKRVKGKSGKFKVKAQKVNFQKVVNVRTPSPQKAQLDSSKILPPAKEEEKVEVEKEPSIKDILNFLKGDLLDGLSSIVESLTQINQTLKEQNQIDRKSRETKRRTGELEKKSKRESELESKPTKKKEEENKLKTPVVSFFDSIKKFVTNVLLGSVVLGLFKWLKDPKNEKAINGFGQFLTDNAPLILGGLLAIAALPIASTLLGLTTGILGGIGTLSKALGGLGGLLLRIPGLGALMGAAGPVAGAIALSGAAAVGVALVMKGTYDAIRGEIAGGGDFAKVDEQLRKKLAGYGITETGMAFKKGSKKQQKLSVSQQKVYEEIQGKRDALRKLKEERDAALSKHYTKKSKRSARVLTEEGKKIKRQYDQKALKLFGEEQTQIQPQTSKTTDYVSPFAGARDRAMLNASKITGNAPITIGEKASAYSASRGRAHRGRDIAAPSGTGLTVPSESVITDKGVDGGYGNYVVFKDSNGVEHFYGHMIEQSPLKVGDTVSPGNIIGRVGSTGTSTGPHLHWEVSRVMGEVGRPRANIIDPIEMGFPAQAPFTGKVEAAQIAQTPIPTPSIPSPTGRSNITMLPLIGGAGSQQVSSGTSPNQAPVPNFSSEDPNNMTMLTVKAIYNMVG